MLTLYRQPWAQQGACVGHPHPEWWDAPSTPGSRNRAEQRALELAAAVCFACPVAAQCLAAADAYDVGQVRAGVHVTAEMAGNRGHVLTWPRPPAAHGTPGAILAHSRAGEPACAICCEEDQRRHVMENGWPE